MPEGCETSPTCIPSWSRAAVKGVGALKDRGTLLAYPRCTLSQCLSCGTEASSSWPPLLSAAPHLQATPGSLGAREAQDLLRFWMRQAFDTAPAGCCIFAYLTEVCRRALHTRF